MTGPGLEIRPYAASDRAACVALFDANCPEYFAANERADYTAFLDACPAGYLVCLAGGDVTGAYGLIDRTPGTASLNWILIDPRHQRRGTGSAMMRRADELARARGVTLVTIAASHKSAPFFARFGAVAVAETPDGWGTGMHRIDMEWHVGPGGAASTPYDQIAVEFAGARTALRPNEARYLDLLLAPLPTGSTVLDLGCGNGHPIATYITDRGHHVVGVDGSAAMLAVARARFPGERWIHSLIERAEFTETFDAVVCWDALFHIRRLQWPAIVAKMHRWLRPGGRLMVSSGGVVDPDGAGFTDTMFGHAFYYDSLPPEAMTALLEMTGFSIVLAEMCDIPSGGNGRGKWATIASKNTAK
jgi:GNAT superfamily N-acetyltransferase/protein-L-isoaspartate O-methyltransferase